MKIKYTLLGNATPVTQECGTYTFERAKQDPAGPFILTFLSGPDRQDENNEITSVVPNVMGWEIVDQPPMPAVQVEDD